MPILKFAQCTTEKRPVCSRSLWSGIRVTIQFLQRLFQEKTISSYPVTFCIWILLLQRLRSWNRSWPLSVVLQFPRSSIAFPPFKPFPEFFECPTPRAFSNSGVYTSFLLVWTFRQKLRYLARVLLPHLSGYQQEVFSFLGHHLQTWRQKKICLSCRYGTAGKKRKVIWI